MDALMLCLYDKTPRASRAGHVMNNRKNTFECQLTLQISNTIYVIKKRGTRKKTNEVKVDVEFLRQEIDGTFTSLTGQERRDTNSIIRSYVGTYEDFILTTFTNNMSGALFIDTSHSERKDLLSQFMGMNIFDKLHDIANEESKQMVGMIKRFNKNDISDKLANVQNKIEELQSEESVVVQKLDYVKGVLAECEVTKSILLRDLLPLAKEVEDIESLMDKKNKYEAQVELNLTEKKNLQEKSTKLLEFEDKLIETNAAIDVKQLTIEIEKLKSIQSRIVELKNKKKQTTTSISEKERLISKLSSIKYNAECDVCVKNNTTFIDELSDAKQKVTELSAQDTAIDLELEALLPKIANIDVYLVQLDEYNDNTNKLHKIDAEKLKVSSSIESLDSKLHILRKNIEDVNSMIVEYNNNLDAISHNKDVEAKLTITEFDITANKKKIDKIQSTMLDVSSELKVAKNIKTTILTELRDMEEIESKFNAYKYYLQATCRDGVPRMLLSKVIPTIQAEINTILSQLVGFTITLEMEGKNINAYLNYDHERIWPLENCSGMERFISGIAMRVALLNASNLPKSNFLLIDEGFGTLDSDHLSSMQTLFNLLKTQFEFIFIVSHLDTARDMVDNSLEIRHKDGYSYINV
jgi:DNA repair exonuclease SbcCD ATPase subunit